MNKENKLTQRIIAMGITDPEVAYAMMARYLRTGKLSAK